MIKQFFSQGSGFKETTSIAIYPRHYQKNLRNTLWIFNAIFLIALIIGGFAMKRIDKTIPINFEMNAKIKDQAAPLTLKKETSASADQIEMIYGPRDIFGLYIEPELPILQEKPLAPMPIFQPPPEQAVPPKNTPVFAPPLNVTLSGIIVNGDENSSIAFILEDSGGEKSYNVGSSIKDGTIIKIMADYVIFLRSNGQQETLYLKKQDPLWKIEEITPIYSKALSDGVYCIGDSNFVSIFPTLGALFHKLDLIPQFEQGKFMKFGIGKNCDAASISQLGLLPQDILVSINEKKFSTTEDRIEILDFITNNPTETISVQLLRNKKPLTLKYTRAPFIKTDAEKEEPSFTQEEIINENKIHTSTKEDEPLPKKSYPVSVNNNNQKIRSEPQPNSQKEYAEMIQAIRGRLIENIQQAPSGYL